MIPTTKICTICGESKPVYDFYKRKTGYLNSQCKPCNRQTVSKWKKENREKANKIARTYYRSHLEASRKRANKWCNNNKDKKRNYLIKSKYGISTAEYDEMKLFQNNVCAICNNKDPLVRLSIDHCHKTNIVRGLLCRTCNAGLGAFKDSLYLLENAKKYLMKLNANSYNLED